MPERRGSLSAFSIANACDLSEPEIATVAAIIDAETLKLTDGRTLRLIGAKAPRPPLGWRGEVPWPFVEEAKRALESLASGKMVELRFGGRNRDRHGHLLAQAFVIDGAERLWLQEAMVAEGLARVYSLPDSALAYPSSCRGNHRRGPSGSDCGARRPIASPPLRISNACAF